MGQPASAVLKSTDHYRVVLYMLPRSPGTYWRRVALIVRSLSGRLDAKTMSYVCLTFLLTCLSYLRRYLAGTHRKAEMHRALLICAKSLGVYPYINRTWIVIRCGKSFVPGCQTSHRRLPIVLLGASPTYTEDEISRRRILGTIRRGRRLYR